MGLIGRIVMLASLLLALGAPATALAQFDNRHLEAELVPSGPVRPGETTEVALLMTPDDGWHGYWSNPGDAGYGIIFDWSLPTGWEAGEPEYPVPETLVFGGLMNHVYESQYAVIVPISVPADARDGARVPISLDAEWLVCTDTLCVSEQGTVAATITVGPTGMSDTRFDGWRSAIPAQLDSRGSFQLADNRLRIGIPIPLSLDVSAPHVFLDNEDLVDYVAPQEYWREGDSLIVGLDLKGDEVLPPVAVTGILKLDDAGNGVRFTLEPGDVALGGTLLEFGPTGDIAPLWTLLLLALAGGLLLNIMPCVFPILSLKALSLARAGESEVQARREGISYTAGVMLATLALGALMLVLRAAGNEIGWAFQLQEPGVVVGLLLLAAAITANFAGLFEVPSISFTRGGQPMGSFGTGLLAAFVATPCTGPFMAAAMGAALLLPPLPALLLFAALGLGLALPFLLLGFVPPLRRLLPRPGAWMNTFRKIMAVPMGLTALALLWLCWRLGGAEFALLALALALVLLVGLAFAGRRQRTGKRAFVPVLASIALVAGVGVLSLPALYAPPARSQSGLIAAEPFSQQALAEARASGKPVFVWFTADWCVTCKVNENVAIEREATRAAFEEAGVIALVGDWTRKDPEITRFLTSQGVGGVPLYLWYSADGEAQQLPQILTPSSLTSLADAS